MSKYLLSIDQGTTSSKIVIYNTNFKVIDSLQKQLKQYFPKNGWVEHDALEIWKDVKFLISKIIKKNHIKYSQILSIGIANQRETTVMWNKKNGIPIQKAIVWQDRRTNNFCKVLRERKLDKKIQNITGLIIDPYFSSTKIKWIIDHNKEAKKLIKRNNLLFGTIDTWLLWNLTEKKSHLTDITNASRTMLFDPQREQWSDELLKIFNIPKEILPQVTPNTYNFGETNLFNVGPIKINGMAGDQQAANIGQACFKKGQSKSTDGTGCFILTNIGKEFKLSKNKLLTTVAYKIGNKKIYCFEGTIFVAGSAIQWLRDNLLLFKKSRETNKLYEAANPIENIIVIPALTGLGAPHWKPNVRGGILVLTRNTSIADIVKATLDSIGFQTSNLIKCIQKDAKTTIKEIRVDGGMIENENFIQSLANILQIKIIKPVNSETTALGVAYLAALGAGVIHNTESITGLWKSKKIFTPKIKKNEIQKKIKKRDNAMNFLVKYHS